ncbi:MAG: hypothetical protein LBC87_02760 [Fibromonadaceae bacterium]|jgi:hypothetical protein|nr:hypothetical protein [Fibromonadaceae bacterium]
MKEATETVATATEIKRAMGTLRLGEWADDLLDEIELDRRLEISLMQADKGMTMSLEEAEARIAKRFANGYDSRR